MTAVAKFTAQFKSEGRLQDLRSALRFIYAFELAIGVISSLGLIAFATPIADHYFSKNESSLFVLAFMAITPGLLSGVLSSALEGAQVFRYQTLHALTLSPLSLLVKVVLLYKGYGLLGLFWANLAFALFNLVFHHMCVRREGLFRPHDSPQVPAVEGETSARPTWKQQLATYMRSMVGIHFVDLLVWSRSENYFLGRFCQAAEIAYYNLAQNLLLRFTGIVPSLMWKLLLPLTAEQSGREDRTKLVTTYRMSLRYAACFSFPVITACYLSAYELIVIFYGHAYADAKTSFQILCFGAVITSLAQPSAAALYATNRHGFILRYGLVLGVLNIITNILWIPKYGACGAAASYALTTALGAAGGYFYTWKTLKLGMPFGSFARCALASVGLAAVVYHWLRLPIGPFDLFIAIKPHLQSFTGHDFEILLGARTLRFTSGLAIGMTAYALVLFIIAKLQPEDLRVLESLKKYLPAILVNPLRRLVTHRLKPSGRTHG